MSQALEPGEPAPETAEELLEGSPSGYLYARSDGLILKVNSTFLKWTGYSHADLVNQRRFVDLLTVPGRIFYETHVAPAKRMHGFINELALEVTRADGTPLPALVSVAQKRDEQGNPQFDRILVFNATERRRYENELLLATQAAGKARDELAAAHSLLEEKIQALEDRERDLRVANGALRKSNEDLGQFAHVASHDLQAPLRTMAMYVDLFKRKYGSQMDSAGEGLLSRVTEAAGRMQALIRDLLSLSRTGTQLQPRWEELSHVVGLARTHLEAAVRETGATIESHDLPKLMIDPGPLAQVFQNLMGNAIKYRHPDRPPRIVIRAKPGRDEWEISVSDNGSGFDPAKAAEIFSAFTRLHGGEIPGTGIGLAICRKVIESHGGRIWATSTPGTGSVFSFTLPVIPVQLSVGVATGVSPAS